MKMPSIKIATATFALIAVATSAAAFPYPGNDRFTDATTGYRVRVSDDGRTMHLSGRQPATHQTFELAVTGNKVTGSWAGQPVNYTLRSDGRGVITPVTDVGVIASQ